MPGGRSRRTALEVWTDQHPVVLDETGRWHADGRRVPKAVRPAFLWMRRQMRERVAGATGRPVVWLNVAPALRRDELCDWSCTRKDDVCNKTHTTPGKALLRVRVPAERVLLSDYELWDRCVVHYQYIPADPDDAVRWDRAVRRTLGAPSDGPTPALSVAWPKQLIQDLASSWSRIFDVRPGRSTQSTIERLDLSEVVDAIPALASTISPVGFASLRGALTDDPTERARNYLDGRFRWPGTNRTNSLSSGSPRRPWNGSGGVRTAHDWSPSRPLPRPPNPSARSPSGGGFAASFKLAETGDPDDP